MAAGGLPTPTVQWDDGTGTFPFDITAYVRIKEGIAGGRGRQDELAQTAAQQITLVLDNTDGRFTMGSTLIASPSPIKLDAQIRVKLTANATTVNRYTGNLIAAPASWPSGGDEFTLVKVTLIDPQAAFDRRPLQSWVEEEYLLDLPAAIYPLNEPSTAVTAADSSGSQSSPLIQTGSGSAVAFGRGASLPSSGNASAQFAGGLRLSNALNFTSAPAAISVSFFFSATIPGAIAQVWSPGSQILSVVVDGAGVIRLGAASSGLSLNAVAVNGLDGLFHHVEIVISATIMTLYVDGSLIASSGILALLPSGTTLGLEVGGYRYNVDGSAPGFTTAGVVFTGAISDVGVFTSAISAGRVATHALAGLNGFAGESGTAHLTRVAGYAGMPIGTLDTSLTNVAMAPIEGLGASAVANSIAEAEFGIAYLNGAGAVDFHNRNRGPLKTAPDVTVDANFLDPGTEIAWDMAGVVNYLDVTAAGTSVTQVARNTTSEFTNKHGRYPGDSKTYLVQTDAEALDRGNWIVNTKGEPLPRAGQLVVDLMTMTAAQQAAWLAVEADHWIQITGLPATTHGGTTLDVVVEGWAEVIGGIGDSAEWTLTLNVVARAFFTAWILGDATYGVLGSTTKLYI